MNTIKKLIGPALVVGVLSLGQGVAQAQQPMPHGMFGQPMMQPGMMQPMMPGMAPGMMSPAQMNPMAMLKLTEEQQKQLADIGNQARDQSMALMKRMTESAQKLPALVGASQPNAKSIGAAYAQMFDIQRQMIEQAVNTYNKQLAVFNQEQRKLWDAMRKQMPGMPQPAN